MHFLDFLRLYFFKCWRQPKKNQKKSIIQSCLLLPSYSLLQHSSKQAGLQTVLFFPARPLSHTLNLLCCHRVGAHGGGPALPARLPCLSVYNRCLCSAGTNGIQSVSLGIDRVAGLTPRPVIYLSMVSNRGVVRHDVGTTDQSDALLSRAGEGWQGLVNKDVGLYRPSGSSKSFRKYRSSKKISHFPL